MSYTLYEHPLSGNCYKVRLLLSHLDLDYERVSVDLEAEENKTPEFLALNPNHRVPVLVRDGKTAIFESAAILVYLAEGTRFLPDDRTGRAQTLSWLFFEQNNVEPALAMSRYWIRFLGNPPELAERLAARQAEGRRVLGVMDGYLADHDFFMGEIFTIADVALYAYSHLAPQAEISLDEYRHVLAWHRRVEDQPGHIAMER